MICRRCKGSKFWRKRPSSLADIMSQLPRELSEAFIDLPLAADIGSISMRAAFPIPLLLLIAVGAIGCGASSAEAEKAILKVGGKVYRNGNSTEITSVDLSATG